MSMKQFQESLANLAKFIEAQNKYRKDFDLLKAEDSKFSEMLADLTLMLQKRGVENAEAVIRAALEQREAIAKEVGQSRDRIDETFRPVIETIGKNTGAVPAAIRASLATETLFGGSAADYGNQWGTLLKNTTLPGDFIDRFGIRLLQEANGDKTLGKAMLANAGILSKALDNFSTGFDPEASVVLSKQMARFAAAGGNVQEFAGATAQVASVIDKALIGDGVAKSAILSLEGGAAILDRAVKDRAGAVKGIMDLTAAGKIGDKSQGTIFGKYQKSAGEISKAYAGISESAFQVRTPISDSFQQIAQKKIESSEVLKQQRTKNRTEIEQIAAQRLMTFRFSKQTFENLGFESIPVLVNGLNAAMPLVRLLSGRPEKGDKTASLISVGGGLLAAGLGWLTGSGSGSGSGTGTGGTPSPSASGGSTAGPGLIPTVLQSIFGGGSQASSDPGGTAASYAYGAAREVAGTMPVPVAPTAYSAAAVGGGAPYDPLMAGGGGDLSNRRLGTIELVVHVGSQHVKAIVHDELIKIVHRLQDGHGLYTLGR